MGIQGLKQFLAVKQEMLAQYEVAKIYSKANIVKASHGNVAEAMLRNWLSEFLPKRYGVTSGRIISPDLTDKDVAPHYDVIIYEQMDSPVLWIEDNLDNSQQGKVRAIPVDYVCAVLEVKSTLNATTAKQSIKKLEELRHLLEHKKNESFNYQKYLPENFCSAAVFFEIKQDNEYNGNILNNLLPQKRLRGYLGGVILKGESANINSTGFFTMNLSDKPTKSNVGNNSQSLIDSRAESTSIEYENNVHHNIFLSWGTSQFAWFAFVLLSKINGTELPSFIPSFHGLS